METDDVGMVGWLLWLSGSRYVRSSNSIKQSLHLASFNNSREVAQLLIINKADFQVRDKNNETPFQCASYNNRAEVAQILITHKTDIEARDKDDRTPLHHVPYNNSAKVA